MDWERLDEFVHERMRRTRLPGLSLALVRDGEVVHSRGYGFRDLAQRAPATAHTAYGIGSVTKSFTALAVLMLAEEGKLSPDDPVDRFLPITVRPHGERITIGHLLAHTSGIPALGYAEAEIRSAQGTGGRYLALATVDDFVAWVNGAADWVEARPGQRWLYLNEGYILLGGVLEELTGTTYAQFVRERILQPLGMDETGFLGEEFAELATPYIVPAQGAPKQGTVAPLPIGSDGALVSTVSDLARYLRLFLNRGAPLIAPETFATMVAPRVALPHAPALPEGEGQGSYAYGLMIQPLGGRTLIGHGGSVLVYTAYLGFIPEEGLGVALLANGSGYPLGQLAQVALLFLLGEDFADLPFVRLESLGEALFGTYATFRDTMRATVRPAGGAVELVIEDREAPQRIVLTVEEVGSDETRLRAHLGDRTLPVLFRKRGHESELVYERYKLRRVSPLS